MTDVRPDVPAVAVEDVSKMFGATLAVDDVSLDVREGEFFSLLGPSGCGKTTLLRMLAGFERPDAGRIRLRGDDVTSRPAHQRAVNTVFQSYELFPHMTVFENVAYGLKIRKVAKDEIRRRVAEMLEIVGIGGLEKRSASQLSGGQQQRVALARALVNRPAVLLLDEPLSALDVKLRKRMQLELKAIQLEIGTTFVYVTHDQEEALFLSDRMGVMSGGKLLQVGAPREIYERPGDPFVADFIGSLNDLTVRIDAVEDDVASGAATNGDRIAAVKPGVAPGGTLRVGVRPERVQLHAPPGPSGDGSHVAGTVRDAIYLGPVTHLVVETAVGRLVVQQLSDPGSPPLAPGAAVVAAWPLDASIVLPDADEPATSLEAPA